MRAYPTNFDLFPPEPVENESCDDSHDVGLASTPRHGVVGSRKIGVTRAVYGEEEEKDDAWYRSSEKLQLHFPVH